MRTIAGSIASVYPRFGVTITQTGSIYPIPKLTSSQGTIATLAKVLAGQRSTSVGSVLAGAPIDFSASNAETYVVVRTASSGTVTPTERMRISSTGNVGIGTTSPAALFDVHGHAANSGTSATVGTCGSSPSISGNDTRGVVT